MDGIEEKGAGEPRGQVVAFPPVRRIAAIRATARAIFGQPTPERQDRIRHHVAGRLFAELGAAGLPEDQQDEKVGAFFHAVDQILYQLEADVRMAVPME
ncbi:MAG: DUF6074 family protein [Rhizobiaceae bacterium]|nr:DUF6074 family protein [Rhizobiaceae bacterium]MCV0407820.1 DUF6074 family protein [Rhizobiaceae bacterium]